MKNGVSNFGMIRTKAEGYDLAEAAITGWLSV